MQPITILSTLLPAGIGVLLLLMAVHIDFTVIALVEIIFLIGIVKNIGNMLVDFALEAERLMPEESIFKADTLRFRPIPMTTMAALFGALPLMLGSGAGVRIAAAARLHHRRRLASQPNIDAVLDQLQTKLFGTPQNRVPQSGPAE